MDRAVINQESYPKENPQNMFFTPDNSEELSIMSIGLGGFDNSLMQGNAPTKKQLEECALCISNEVSHALQQMINAGMTKFEYSGVSLTPFIFLAAFEFKKKNIQLNNISLWHNYRDIKHGWDLLDETEIDIEPLNLSIGNKTAYGEYLIAISTSFEINRDHLKCLQSSTITDIKYTCPYTAKNKRDAIFNRKQVNEYCSEIMNLVISRKMSKVYLTISSSVAMTFALAYNLLFSNFLPSITIYHYDLQVDSKRPWGIEFRGSEYNIVLT